VDVLSKGADFERETGPLRPLPPMLEPATHRIFDPNGIVRETSLSACEKSERSCEWPLEIPNTAA